jgi:hypothetical protein
MLRRSAASFLFRSRVSAIRNVALQLRYEIVFAKVRMLNEGVVDLINELHSP